MAYQRLYPDDPWLTGKAIAILKSTLKKTDIGLEFGSGRSTLWFAKRVKRLTSVEHNEDWYKNVLEKLKEDGLLSVVDYRFFKGEENAWDKNPEYVNVIDRFKDGSFDFALVDGAYRDRCAMKVLKKIKPGGLLIIDNVNWFLPSKSYAPDSRTIDQGPAGKTWVEVHRAVSKWRTVWTSNGVWDTALFFKPAQRSATKKKS